jgi:RNA polymerase sigma-70 factor (ECF subfamily)
MAGAWVGAVDEATPPHTTKTNAGQVVDHNVLADAAQLDRLRSGDTEEFERLVVAHHALMWRVARAYVATSAVAEDVVQDTWIAVLDGLTAFEGRSSLRTWIFQILKNVARRRGQREARVVPFSSLVATELDERTLPSVDPERFIPPSDHEWPGHWLWPPRQWEGGVEERLLHAETQALMIASIEELPPVQRTVLWLRCMEGWASEEVCLALEISAANQRVLLHRARSKLRASLEALLEES